MVLSEMRGLMCPRSREGEGEEMAARKKKKATLEPYKPSGREQWRKVPGHGGELEASDRGRIRTYRKKWAGEHTPKEDYWLAKPRLLRIETNAYGPPRVLFRGEYVGINHLILMAFKGLPPTADHVCHHKDSDPKNCKLGNLEGKTPSEISQETTPKGEEVYNAALTNEQVAQLRKVIRQGGISYRQARDQVAPEASYGAAVRAIWGHTYRDVKEPPVPPKAKKAITWSREDDEILREMYAEDVSDADIAALLGRSKTSVGSARKRLGLSRLVNPEAALGVYASVTYQGKEVFGALIKTELLGQLLMELEDYRK